MNNGTQQGAVLAFRCFRITPSWMDLPVWGVVLNHMSYKMVYKSTAMIDHKTLTFNAILGLFITHNCLTYFNLVLYSYAEYCLFCTVGQTHAVFAVARDGHGAKN